MERGAGRKGKEQKKLSPELTKLVVILGEYLDSMIQLPAPCSPAPPLKITQYPLTSANFSKLTHDCHLKLGGQSETKQLDCGYREGGKLFSPISWWIGCFCTSQSLTIAVTKIR
jgi:hypothetical protein